MPASLSHPPPPRYVLQYFDGPFRDFCYDYWPYFAAGYSGAFLLHFLLTTRDGYVISLTHTLNLPALFKASSSRPDPVGCTCRLCHNVATEHAGRVSVPDTTQLAKPRT